ncbi:hypothetical protein T4E_3705 [Trichinella pseudospiralis]|uniref:Uncharacterized protein n=1 Tax=Trichinella pseudospiralis TaxID=6337 RepID=A0A0V0XPP4_TRIPS|nr:hypothetical protein T4E_3705 [Trichinella pseudospiralis]
MEKIILRNTSTCCLFSYAQVLLAPLNRLILFFEDDESFSNKKVSLEKVVERGRIRTCNLRFRRPTRYPLRHTPTFEFNLVRYRYKSVVMSLSFIFNNQRPSYSNTVTVITVLLEMRKRFDQKWLKLNQIQFFLAKQNN